MIYTFEYDRKYDPAMPVAQVEIWYAATSPTFTLTAIVDSGADATILPLIYLRQIRARKFDQAWVRGITPQRTLIDRYRISLRMGSHIQHKLLVVGDSLGQEAILGRDLLNQLASYIEWAGGCCRNIGLGNRMSMSPICRATA